VRLLLVFEVNDWVIAFLVMWGQQGNDLELRMLAHAEFGS
jgi:hypothetical protein